MGDSLYRQLVNNQKLPLLVDKIVVLQSIEIGIGISLFSSVVAKRCYFHCYLGKIPILTNMFQRGWLKPPTRLVVKYRISGNSSTKIR